MQRFVQFAMNPLDDFDYHEYFWSLKMKEEYLKPLQASVILDAFHVEAGELIPKILKILDRSLKDWESKKKRVRNFHYEDQFREWFELECVEILERPDAEIALLKRLEAIKRGLDGPTSDDSITADMVARAKSVPIENLYSFEKIKRFGGRIKALCPFHSEKTPSFVIYTKGSGSASENTFHCFGCGVGRDAIDFYCKINGLTLPNDFPRAVKALIQNI